jgi:hypothetical protein
VIGKHADVAQNASMANAADPRLAAHPAGPAEVKHEDTIDTGSSWLLLTWCVPAQYCWSLFAARVVDYSLLRSVNRC